MATVFEIPITNTESSFKLRTILESVELVLRFDWNGRDSRWQLSISDAKEEPLIMGLALNINTELIHRYEMSELPAGRLALYDTSGKFLEAGRDDLGGRCKLLYMENA